MENGSNYYWYEGEKIQLRQSTQKSVIVDDPSRINLIRRKWNEFSEDTDERIFDIGGGKTLIENIVLESFYEKELPIEDKTLKRSSVFDQEDETLFIASEQLIVTFKVEATEEEIQQFNRLNNVKTVERFDWDDRCFLLALEDPNDNVIDVANRIHLNTIVDFAHPNFIKVFSASSPPNDKLLGLQWGLLNRRQFGGNEGEDIKGPQAWTLSRGKPFVTIAVIDDGVDYSHEDLMADGKLVTGYDAFKRTNSIELGPLDTHGTACAGIAAASGNNRLGIVGVAPECSVMGVKVLIKKSSTKWITSDIIIADGINTAAARGADILSCSFSWKGSTQIITNAIRRAKDGGRKGLGCVICAAAGNNFRGVQYPASLPEVIAVSACNQYGEFKSPFSSDGEHWGSCFGPEIDLCAPGVLIATTTVMGSGPNNAEPNYVTNFNGTSAATPFVAGVAALILSERSHLHAQDVENILKKSADSLSRNVPDEQVGFGRVNAWQALKILDENLLT